MGIWIFFFKFYSRSTALIALALFYIKLLIRYKKLSHPGCSLEVLLPPHTTFHHFTPLRRLLTQGLGECSLQVTGGKPPQSRKGFRAHLPALPDMTLWHFYSLECRDDNRKACNTNKVLCPLQCIILVMIENNKCQPSDRSRTRSLAWQPLNERSKVVITLDWTTATGLQKSIQATLTGWYFSPNDMTYHLIKRDVGNTIINT